MNLTPKQEKFCQGLIKGLNQTDAFRQAYDCSRMKDATVNSSAYKLSLKPYIRARVADLNAKIEDKLAYSALQSFKKLQDIQDLALNRQKVLNSESVIEDPDLPSAIRTEELKGKLAGLYVEKVDTKSTVSVSNNIDLKIVDEIAKKFKE